MMMLSASSVSAAMVARIMNWYFAASMVAAGDDLTGTIMPGTVTMPAEAATRWWAAIPDGSTRRSLGRAASHVVT